MQIFNYDLFNLFITIELNSMALKISHLNQWTDLDPAPSVAWTEFQYKGSITTEFKKCEFSDILSLLPSNTCNQFVFWPFMHLYMLMVSIEPC